MLLVIAYIRFFASASGKLLINVDYLVEWLGYKVNRKPQKINSSIAKSLEYLKDKGYITYDTDLTVVTNHNKCFQCTINDDNNIFEIGNSSGDKTNPYVILVEHELDSIIKSEFGKKDWLLVVYLHMKKRINLAYSCDTDGYFYSSLNTLHEDCSHNINISLMSITRVIDELVKIGLLFEHKTGSYILDGNYITAVNFYALEKERMNHQVCDEIAKRMIKQFKDIDVEKFIPSTGLKNINDIIEIQPWEEEDFEDLISSF